jgi:hypothetical protein
LFAAVTTNFSGCLSPSDGRVVEASVVTEYSIPLNVNFGVTMCATSEAEFASSTAFDVLGIPTASASPNVPALQTNNEASFDRIIGTSVYALDAVPAKKVPDQHFLEAGFPCR